VTIPLSELTNSIYIDRKDLSYKQFLVVKKWCIDNFGQPSPIVYTGMEHVIDTNSRWAVNTLVQFDHIDMKTYNGYRFYFRYSPDCVLFQLTWC
jgi:hypothetical protein